MEQFPSVQVWDADMQPISIIPSSVYDYFRYERHLRTPDVFELQINKNRPKAETLLSPDAFFLVYMDGSAARIGRIEQLECSLPESGLGDEKLIIKGRSGGMFAERIASAYTSTGTGYDTQTGAAESLMRHYVDVNSIAALDGGGNSAPNRTIPNLTLATDEGRGTTCTYSARYETVAEVLQALAYAGGLGWEVILDTTTRELVFQIIAGTDHSSTSESPVIFSPQLGNLLSIDYMHSLLDRKSLAYVGGSGEDASRIIQTVYLDSTEPSGYDRREVFVDASNTSLIAELTTAGQSELEEMAGTVFLDASLISSAPLKYGEDYNLGDTVTVTYGGVATADVQIISIVDEIVGGGRGAVRKVSAKLGTEPADIRRIVRRTTRKTIEQTK
jgi:hypothetical protein